MGRKTVLIIAGLLSACGVAAAVEIPLDGTSGRSGDRETTSIAYVNIEQLFEEHPLTQRLKGEFQAEAEKRKKEIASLEQELETLQGVVVSSTTDLNRAKADLEVLRLTLQAAASANETLLPGTTESAPVPDAGASIASREADIKRREDELQSLKADVERRREELRRKVRESKQELSRLEEKQSAMVLADIYKIIEKVARDENITIILNKNDVLYGQAPQDLTDEIRKRLQGR